MNLRLEPLSLDHLDGVMTWVNDPEVTFYFARLGHVSREEEAAYLQKLIDSPTDEVYSIFDGDEYLGQVGLNQIYRPAQVARLGILLPQHAWGRGVAREAVSKLLDLAFEGGLHKLWLQVRTDNAKGLHLWTSMGFRLEGIMREEYRVNGRYYDMARLALLETEWTPS